MNVKRAIIVACKARPNYVLWIRFDDGLEGEVNLSDLVGDGVFKSWESKKFFESVKVSPESKTVCWGEDIDLDPYVLRNDIIKKMRKLRKPPRPRLKSRSRLKTRK